MRERVLHKLAYEKDSVYATGKTPGDSYEWGIYVCTCDKKGQQSGPEIV